MAQDGDDLPKYLAERLYALSDRVFVAIVDMMKWLIASLLAVNGGALIAIANHPDGIGDLQSGIPYFVAGIVCALASGFGLSYVWAYQIGGLEQAAGILISGPDDFEEQIKAPLRKVRRCIWLSIVPTSIGVGSLVLFVIGCGGLTGKL